MSSFDGHANFAVGAVLTAPSPATSGTSVVLQSGQGALMPAVPFNATAAPPSVLATLANSEIVRVTAIVGDTLTIVRAQEGSTAQSIAAGWQIAATITKKMIVDLETLTVVLGGRTGGQIVLGGLGSGESLTLGSTADASKGSIVLQDRTTVCTIADTSVAAGAALAVQNLVISDSIHQTADQTQVREGTPLLIKFDHVLDFDAGHIGPLDLGPRTSLPLRPANWSAFHKTHITSGSNGYNVTAPAGWTVPGVLNVTSTTGFDAAGAIRITMGGSVGGTIAVLNYTGKTSNTFTGCTFVSGTGTIATGSTVQNGATGTEAFPRGYVTLEGTTTFAQEAAIYSDSVDYISLRVTKNAAGVANDIAGKNVFINNNTYMADGATINGTPPGFGGFYPSLNSYGNVCVVDQPIITTDATNGGQLNNWVDVSFYSGPLHFEHTHTKWRCGLYIDDADRPGNSFGDGLGVIDTAVGVQINELVTAATNIAINVGNPDPSVTPLFRVMGDGKLFAQGGIFGGTAPGQLFEIASTSDTVKGTIVLDASTVHVGASSYTLTNALGATNFQAISLPNAVTMNSSGGAGGTGNGYGGVSHANTVVFQQAGNIFAGGVAYTDAAIYKNTSTTALALGALYSFYAAPTVEADAATVTASIYTGYLSLPTTARITSGGLTIGTLTGYDSGAVVGANTTVTKRVGFHVSDATNNGVLTNQYGILIDPLSAAGTTNVGLWNQASSQFGTSAQTTISNAGALSTSASLATTGSGTLSVAGTSTVLGGLYGSASASGNLVLNATTDATKGYINLVDEVRVKATDQTFTANPLWLGWSNTYTLDFASATLGTFVSMAPTVLFKQSGHFLGAALNIAASPTYKNVTSGAGGSATTFGNLTGIASSATVTADTSTGMAGSLTLFSSSPTLSVANNGTLTLASVTHYAASISAGAGTTTTAITGLTFGATVAGASGGNAAAVITTLTGISIANATGSGTVTTQIGLDIVALTKGGTNIGIQCKSSVVLGSAGQTTISTAGAYSSSAAITTTNTVTAAAFAGAGATMLAPNGALAETVPRAIGSLSNLAALTSGTLRLQAIWLPIGTVVTNISFMSGTTAAGTPTNWWFCLLDSSRAVLGKTADQTSTAWAANTLKTVAISGGAFTTTYSGLHYIGILMAATTVISMIGPTDSAGNTIALTPILSGNSNTGLTVPGGLTGTATAITASGNLIYGYVS